MFQGIRVFSGSLMFAALVSTALLNAQVEPGATGGGAGDSDSQMMTPPPVSGAAYPTTFGSNERSNVLSGGISVNGAYVNNVFPGSTLPQANEGTFSIAPSITLTRSSGRVQMDMGYVPSFLIYVPTSTLNTFDQSAELGFGYRASQRVSIDLADNFYRTSSVFDAPYNFSNGLITGSTQSPTTTVIAPFATQLGNTAHGIVSYQFGRDGMVGAGGGYSTTQFPNPANSAGLSNSNDIEASAFYNRRLSRTQYIGLEYEFGRVTTDYLNQQSTIDTQLLLPFYTLYLSKTISFSVSAGIERTDLTLVPLPAVQSWSPSVIVSTGWQTRRANLAASYAHTITSGGGLFGAFHSNTGSASFSWRLSSAWTATLTASGLTESDVSSKVIPNQGGTLILGQGMLSRAIGEKWNAGFGFERLHEEYSGVSGLAGHPDSYQVFGRITYQFQKPLGR